MIDNSLPSDIISLNQNDIEDTNVINANVKKMCAFWNPCIVKTPVVVKVNKLMQQ